MSDTGEGVLKNLGVFSTLQAATEVKFFLLSATFALLVDNVFLRLGYPGLLELARSAEALNASNLTFRAILIFVVFSFLTSLILPICAEIFDRLFLETFFRWHSSFQRYLLEIFGAENGSNYQPREHNHVLLGELREKAHLSQESYFLNMLEKYEEKFTADREGMLRFAMYSFYCLVMLVYNFLCVGENALSVGVSSYMGSSQYVWLAIFALVAGAVYRFYGWDSCSWIYCPSLYREVVEKRKKDRCETAY